MDAIASPSVRKLALEHSVDINTLDHDEWHDALEAVIRSEAADPETATSEGSWKV